MKPQLLPYLAAAGVLLTVSSAKAVDPIGPETIDPVGTLYEQNLPAIMFPNGVQMENMQLAPEPPMTSLPAPGGAAGDFPAHSFFDVFVDISLDNGNHFIPMTGTGSMNEMADLPSSSSPSETFDDSLSSLNINGTVNNHSIALTLDPNNIASDTGQTTFTTEPGGAYNIDSFFDVFFDLSVDGGTIVTQQNRTTPFVLVSIPDTTTTLPLFVLSFALLAFAHKRVRAAKA